ncbi:hypothetical protein [Eubacterium xylanophilum]|uniref:hypothetical protein n=1 Tax=Eubacterium xylanophilum TaxID=39497 RepID=UPI0012EB0D81|nr:hypothetical protein [Eubacterium xylanophilum]
MLGTIQYHGSPDNTYIRFVPISEEGGDIMVEAYNLYIGGHIPDVSPKSSVHNRRQLKEKYKSIVSLNNSNPLAMIRLSSQTRDYALDVKELSIEIGEAAQNVLDGESESTRAYAEKTASLFNELLHKSDAYGEAHNRPSRPGAELRDLVSDYAQELFSSGFDVVDGGYLSISEDREFEVPTGFMQALKEKSEYMSMNPMEYVEKSVYSYAHLHQNDIGNSYESSMYSGMMFNSYC